MSINEPSDSTRVAGVLAEFDGPEPLREAAAGLRAAGYARYDAFSPFPVHGLYEAMGRRRTGIPWLVLAGGVTGCAGALLLQWWTNAIDYPYLTSGKPLFGLPANVPVIFEAIILLGALAAFGGAVALSNLPELYHWVFGSSRFRRVTTDGFYLAVEADDPAFDQVATVELFQRLGARATEICHEPPGERRIPWILMAGAVLLVAAALLPPLWIAQVRYSRKSQPRLHLVADMDFQPKYLPQAYSPLFEDTRTMRPPVEGAVPVDILIDRPHLTLGEMDGKPAATFPMPVSRAVAERGRQRFDIFCATCHGLAGDGDGITSELAFEREEPRWIRPLSLHVPTVREQPVGQLFKTISDGIRTMPSYASQIPIEDRWAIVLYVRALERSRNATIQDVPEDLRGRLSTPSKPK